MHLRAAMRASIESLSLRLRIGFNGCWLREWTVKQRGSSFGEANQIPSLPSLHEKSLSGAEKILPLEVNFNEFST